MIGLSLSFCVRDILHGNVALEDVEQIIAGTRARDPEEWEEVLSSYCKVYWHDDPHRAADIALELLTSGKIDQPRIRDERHPGFVDGKWWR